MKQPYVRGKKPWQITVKFFISVQLQASYLQLNQKMHSFTSIFQPFENKYSKVIL